MAKPNRAKRRIDRWLEMPTEIVSNVPKITIIGFNEILIENYKGILEYEDIYIRINTHIGIININGFNLNLEQISEDDISVKGKIDSITLELNIDEEE